MKPISRIVGCLILTVLLGGAFSAQAQYYDPNYNYTQNYNNYNYNYNDPYYQNYNYSQNYNYNNCYPNYNCNYPPYYPQNPTTPNPTTNNAVVNPDSAELFGSVIPNGSQTNVWFDYGPNQSFGFQSGYQSAGAGYASVQVMARVTNLIPNSTYYYRVSAQNQYGLTRGQMQTFTTNSSGGIYNPPVPGGYSAPLATTKAATNVGATSASVHGTIAANGSPTTAWFEYGTSANPANRSETRTVDAAQNNFQLNFLMGNLSPGTAYYYRVVAQNSYGVTRGNVMNFTTSGAYVPPATSKPPANNPPANTTSTGSAGNLMTLTAALEKQRVAPGEETDYILNYKNPARASVRETVLQTTLPPGVEYVIATKLPRIENRTFFFDLETLPANAEGNVSIRIKVSPDAPSNINLHSTLSYKDSQGGQKSASASTGLTVAAANATTTNNTANVSDKVRDGWSWWVWFIIFLLGFLLVVGGYIFYRYNRAKQSFTP